MISIEEIKKLLGWCLDQKMAKNVTNKIEFSNYNDTVHVVNGGRFRALVVGLHFVVALWLIFTALKVLSNHLIFPWWIMNINLVASGLILIIGSISLIIAFNLWKIRDTIWSMRVLYMSLTQENLHWGMSSHKIHTMQSSS